MPLAPGLFMRFVTRPDGRLATVVVRRRRSPPPTAGVGVAPQPAGTVQEKPYRLRSVQACDMMVTTEFSCPVARALAVLGGRGRRVGDDGAGLARRRGQPLRMLGGAERGRLGGGGRTA